MKSNPKILISACLLGYKVRYDGQDCLQSHLGLKKLIDSGAIVSFCPEVSGGLSTPRPPAEIANGLTGEDVLNKKAKVFSNQGVDVTAQFIKGAHNALEIAKKHQIKVAILKAKSPSCGSSKIYDGTFSRKLINGMGVTATLLNQHGIMVFDEDQIDEALECFHQASH